MSISAAAAASLRGQEQAIRTLAGARKLEDLAALPIALPGGRRVRLDELGTVTDGAAEPRTFTRLFDEPIVAFGVTRAKGASDVTVDALIEKRLETIAAAHPEVKFTKVDTQVDSEVGNYHSTMETLIEGAALAIVVVFIFLRDLRATLVTAIALPLSVIPTFWAMDAIGFSLNLVSLLAITLVTGILVDDAIVEIENIVRHMRMGKSAYRASLEAADEIGLAVIAISLSIAAIFSPVSFMGGIAGQYFRQFGLTVAIAVMFSLLVARFVTPVIAAYFLRAPHERSPSGRRGHALLHAARARLRAPPLDDPVRRRCDLRRFAVVDAIAAVRLHPAGRLRPRAAGDRAAAGLAARRHRSRHPRDLGEAARHARGPLGAHFRRQDPRRRGRRAAQGDDRHQSRPQIEARGVAAGHAAQDRRASSPISRTSASGSSRTTASAICSSSSPGPTSRSSTTPRTRSRARCARFPTIENPISTAELDRPELRIVPKPQVAADLGVSTEALSETIRVATLGDIDANLAKFNAGDRLVPIRVELDQAARARARPPAGFARAHRAAARRRRCPRSRTSRSPTDRPRSTATTGRGG